MARFVWHLIIKTNILVLKVAGLWPLNNTYGHNVYAIYALFINIFVDGHNVFQTAYIAFIYKDLQALAAIIFVLFTDWLASIKVYYFVRNTKILRWLMVELKCDEFQPTFLQRKSLLPPNVRSWWMIYATFSTVVVGTLIFWAIFPILDGSYKEYRLPFWAWYPFDTKTSPMYQIIYLYQVFSIWFLAISNVNMDTLMAALMTYTSTQCDILCDNLRNLKGEDFNAKLIAYIEHHKKIVRYGFLFC